MQILQWLFSVNNKKETVLDDVASTRKHLVLLNYCGSERKRKAEDRKLSHRDSKLFAILRRRNIGKAYFYSTINLKRVKSFNRRQHWIQSMRMKKEDFARGVGISQKADSAAAHVGNKVLPISEQTPPSLANANMDQCGLPEKKEGIKGEKSRTLSRMKELLRWATAAKSEKGGRYIGRKMLYFRNKGKLKAVPDDDQLSNDSPKISFRWDVESCSTTSSAFSAISSARNDQLLNKSSMDAKQPLNWITTDSEFVVLEL